MMNFDPMMTQSVDSVYELCNSAYETCTPGFSPNCYSTSSNFEALASLINAAELQQKQPLTHGIGPMQPDRSFANAQQQNQAWLFNKFQSLFGSAYLAKATAHFVAQQIYAGKHMEAIDPDEPDVFAYKTSKGRFTADDRVFDEEQNYLKYLEATKQARKKIREPSSVEEFFQLFDVPYGSALPEYELFAEGFCFSKHGNPSDEFNKRVYEAKALSAEEYDEMRRDFNSNGREAASLTTLFEDSDFPELEQTDKSKQIWEDKSFETTNHTQNNFYAHGDFALQDFVSKRGRGGKKSFEGYCVFCKNIKSEEKMYKNHFLKDNQGKVLCPRLRQFKCLVCGADGDYAHTLQYCPVYNSVASGNLKKLLCGKQGMPATKKNQVY